MKKYAFLFSLLFILLISLAARFQPTNSFPLFGKFIILDPGHGGLDPGSLYKEEYEKDYNLDFSLTLKNELENLGATVILTRSGDYDLSSPNASRRKRSDFENRIKLINEDNPDIYISLHMNSLASSKYYGSQVFYSKINAKNEKLAEILQKNLNTFFKLDRDYKKISDDKYMFKRIDPPGVLIEYGFISSSRDRTNLKTEKYRKDLSKVICAAIIEYF